MANYVYNGIDISRHQGTINWNEVAKSSIDFVIIRAGYGKLIQQEDDKFKANITGATNAGISNIGIYWFSYASTVEEAKQEAAACISVIKPYKSLITLPVFFDQEYCTQVLSATKSVRTECCKVFCEAINTAGYKAGLYA